MSKSELEPIDTTEAVEALDSYIQGRVNSGHELPIGCLFNGLKIYFYHQNSDSTDETEPSKTSATEMEQKYRLFLARNTASFGGASVVSTLDDPAITHVVVDPNCPSEELSSIRESFASNREKLPHLVTVDWIEECWSQRTVLDEEREFTLLPLSFPVFVEWI